MIPGAFDYHLPESLPDACRLLSDLGDDARVVAGGHSLIPMMKLRMALPEHLIDLRAIDALKGITVTDGVVTIGAMTTQAELIASDDLARVCPILRETSLQIADPQIRNLGTIGGNVANGDPGNDMPAVMQALDATYQVEGAEGTRQVKARDFYEGAFFTALEDNEILTAISIPVPPSGHGCAYQKQKRKIGDYATAAAAVLLTMDGGTCRSASIALTNVGDTHCSLPRRRGRLWSARPSTSRDRCCGPGGRSHHLACRRWPRSGRVPHQGRRRDGSARDRTGEKPRRGRSLTMAKMHVQMTVNGEAVEALAEPRTLLIHFLREQQNLTGPHIGCDTGHCGACTVDLDGKSVKSCMVFVAQANGAEVTTIEGIANPDGTMHALQEAFREHHGLQCGYCTPGMITRAYRLLQENPNPTEEDIRYGISGNLCRCTGYQNIVKAIQAAASELSAAKEAAE